MSEISERAVVDLALADFAMVGGDGKLDVIGGGISILGFDPAAGVTSRHSLTVTVWVPTPLCPAEFPVELSLYADGELVRLPELVGEGSPLRVASIVRIESPMHPSIDIAQRNSVGGRHIFVVDFANGLPLTAGGSFEWRARLDGDDDHDASFPFAVAGLPSTPVFG